MPKFTWWIIEKSSAAFHCSHYESVISRLPYRDILYEFTKADARKWKEDRAKQLRDGRSLEEVEADGDDEINRRTLEKEEADARLDILRPRHYRIKDEHYEKLGQFLVTCHCLTAG